MHKHLLIFAAGLMLHAVSAQAATDQACWNRDIERLDGYDTPPEGGDNKFFTGVSSQTGNTNVTMVYIDKLTMRDFAQRLYRIRQPALGGIDPSGCNNEYLNNTTYFMRADAPAPAGAVALQGLFDITKNYPDPGTYVGGGYNFTDGLHAANNKFYRYRNWGANGNGKIEDATAITACDAAAGGPGLASATCQICVNTRGYWLNPAVSANSVAANAAVFHEKWLRFSPPKWVLLHLAYKRLMAGPLLSVLREAALAPNGSTGAQLVQKMLPQSCSGAGRPMNQKMGAIDALTYSSTANPLAEMLFNTGWYMGGQESPWLFANASTFPNTFPNTRSEPCNNCSGDFAVVFSDGRGDAANPLCDVAAPQPFCLATSTCSVLGMGAEGDGNNFLDPALVGGAGTLISGATVRQLASGTCDMDFADDVALWMANTNMTNTAPSKLRTYVVGIGDTNNTYGEMSALQAVASNGGGRYLVADNFTDLEQNIERVLEEIISRTTSFSAAAITSVQTRGSTSAFIPRFRPTEDSKWSGALARYSLFNEFAAGCTVNDYGTRNAVNPNGNASCTEFYLRAADGGFVAENSSGDFVMVNDAVTWDGGWPLRTTPDGGNIAAVPLWEASNRLTLREAAVIAGDTTQARKIYTASPNGSGGYNNTVIDFSVANMASITPLLKLGGVAGETCTALSGRTRNVYATEAECARDIIRFMHGEDVLRETAANRKTPVPSPLLPRPHILGDIFHSTPVLVTPPSPTFLCDLGVVNQCVASLYSTTLTRGGEAAYNSYSQATNIGDRMQFVLVGSNDGMVHAFHSGTRISGTGFSAEYDLGTGDELWAFIPPDLLPKLARYMLGTRHELLVDGTPMVRDVWSDGSGATVVDHQKQADEFHTVAVVGEREGGRQFFALDVTFPHLLKPTFLWSFPPTGTAESLAMGESWNDIGPNAAPIGPIAELDAAGTFSLPSTTTRVKERYVVAFGGGYDPAFLRGRSLHVVDVWTGAEVYRFARADSTSAADLRQNLFPIAAVPAMLDLDSDGLFDTAVVGDTVGQVWTLSLQTPGEDTTGDGLYDNWYAGRAFVQFKGQAIAKRAPFFQRAVATKFDTGEVRVFLGSGDRSQMKDPNGGTCGLSNLSACIRKGCSLDINANPYEIGSHFVSQRLTLGAAATSLTTNTMSHDALGQVAACTDPINSRVQYAVSCPGGQSGSWTSDVYCDWGLSGGLDCPTDTGRPQGAQVCVANGSPCAAASECCSGSCSSNVCADISYSASTIQKTQFYSIKLFDSTTRASFTSAAGALTYDTAALTETNLLNVTTGIAPLASAAGDGWWVQHSNSTPAGYSGLASDERSATSALLLGGCVLWSTVRPNPVTTITCAGTLPLDSAYAYQADAITGAIQCGMAGSTAFTATLRSVSHSTYAAPQQPAPVLSVNAATGQVSYQGVQIDPGSPPTSTTVGTGEIFGAVHWLEVPQPVHDCRHLGNCN